ncbi:MAG: hypothetical protein COB59_00375 [Rhodospirillaceae bacterium]|nr:MAG: hypothetical protein COB59_00375 [Rhodospirillaceae bacterium]
MSKELADMDKRQLKIATRELLNEFPNLQNAATHCRTNTTRLSQYQNFDSPTFMPIDVVLSLETACGNSIVSRQLAKMQTEDDVMPEGDAISESMDLSPAVGELIAFIKIATQKTSSGGVHFSELEKRQYQEIRSRMDKELREVDLAIENDIVAG